METAVSVTTVVATVITLVLAVWCRDIPATTITVISHNEY